MATNDRRPTTGARSATHPTPPDGAERTHRGGDADERRQRWRRRICQGVLSANFGVVVIAWTLEYAMAESESLESAFARLAGMIAALLLLMQVVLMVRVPILERAYGHARLAHLHALVGSGLLLAIGTHVTLYITAHTEAEERVRSTAHLIAGSAPVFAAVLATLALFVVAATSSRSVRRGRRVPARYRDGVPVLPAIRLRAIEYEAWHLIHLTTYLALVAAIPHEVTPETWVASTPALHAYWIGLVAFVYALALTYRLLLPVVQSLHLGLTVVGVREEPSSDDFDVVTVYLADRRTAEVLLGDRFTPTRVGAAFQRTAGSWLPRRRGEFTAGSSGSLPVLGGQFAVLRTWDRHILSGHPYSIRKERGLLAFTVRTPAGKNPWKRPNIINTHVAIEGPYGTWTREARSRDRVTIIVAGVAAAAGLALLNDLDVDPSRVVFVYRFDREEERLFGRELDALQARGVTVHYLEGKRHAQDFVGSGWLPTSITNRTGPQVLSQLSPWITSSDVFIAGPPGWVNQARLAAWHLGVARGYTHSDKFSW